jgi:hypothetical protein|tara:strand:- start:1078 stop:1458 length:381 start_codon:yes stop_codon:yes gene_type:complete
MTICLTFAEIVNETLARNPDKLFMPTLNYLDELSEFEMGDEAWEDYNDLIGIGYEKGQQFGRKFQSEIEGLEKIAFQKYRQFVRSKTYQETMKRRAKKVYKERLARIVEELFLIGFVEKALENSAI